MKKLKKCMDTFLGACLLAILVSGCSRRTDTCLINDTLETAFSEDTKDLMTEPGTEASGQGFLYVHVCGEVEQPGVYELPRGSRAYEAIQAAGGMTSEAAAEAVNQASLLTDGQQIVVPSEQEQSTAIQAESSSGLVNINLAGAAELMTLPGIGEARAADIIAYREANGGFARIEDITKVSGIKDAVFQRIKDKIVV
ncbi:MAG: helix-hairpin-helix domain-containing protein [Candidatus Limivivens sp.]|nr:helix-hairpin-helix domain-containing protein [Candidatus Limivivens sp.]